MEVEHTTKPNYNQRLSNILVGKPELWEFQGSGDTPKLAENANMLLIMTGIVMGGGTFLSIIAGLINNPDGPRVTYT